MRLRGPLQVGAALAAAAVLLAGCWSAIDPKDMDVVVALAFDRSSEGISAVAQVPSAGGGNHGEVPRITGTEGKFFVLEGEGANAADAFEQMAQSSGRMLYWKQLYFIMLTTNLAKKHLGTLVDTTARMPEITGGTSVALIDTSALQFLTATSSDVAISGLQAFAQIERSSHDRVYDVPLWGLFRAFHTPGLDGTAPVFGLLPDQSIEAEGMGIFRGDQLVTVLKGADARSFLIWEGRLNQGTLTILSHNSLAVLRNVRARSALSLAGWRAGLPVFTLTVRVTADLQRTTIDGTGVKPPDLRVMEQTTNDMLKTQLTHLLKIAQQADSDPFGLGAWLRYHDPEAVKQLGDWHAVFPKVQVEFRISTNIFDVGTLS